MIMSRVGCKHGAMMTPKITRSSIITWASFFSVIEASQSLIPLFIGESGGGSKEGGSGKKSVPAVTQSLATGSEPARSS